MTREAPFYKTSLFCCWFVKVTTGTQRPSVVLPPSFTFISTEERAAVTFLFTLRPLPRTVSFWRAWEPQTSFTLNLEVSGETPGIVSSLHDHNEMTFLRVTEGVI